MCIRDRAEVHDDMAETLVAKSDRKGTPAGERQVLRSRATGEYRKAREFYEGLKTRGVLPKAYLKRIDELQKEEDKLRPGAQ